MVRVADFCAFAFMLSVFTLSAALAVSLASPTLFPVYSIEKSTFSISVEIAFPSNLTSFVLILAALATAKSAARVKFAKVRSATAVSELAPSRILVLFVKFILALVAFGAITFVLLAAALPAFTLTSLTSAAFSSTCLPASILTLSTTLDALTVTASDDDLAIISFVASFI